MKHLFHFWICSSTLTTFNLSFLRCVKNFWFNLWVSFLLFSLLYLNLVIWNEFSKYCVLCFIVYCQFDEIKPITFIFLIIVPKIFHVNLLIFITFKDKTISLWFFFWTMNFVFINCCIIVLFYFTFIMDSYIQRIFNFP